MKVLGNLVMQSSTVVQTVYLRQHLDNQNGFCYSVALWCKDDFGVRMFHVESCFCTYTYLYLYTYTCFPSYTDPNLPTYAAHMLVCTSYLHYTSPCLKPTYTYLRLCSFIYVC